jgi:hypothetical protein
VRRRAGAAVDPADEPGDEQPVAEHRDRATGGEPAEARLAERIEEAAHARRRLLGDAGRAHAATGWSHVAEHCGLFQLLEASGLVQLFEASGRLQLDAHSGRLHEEPAFGMLIRGARPGVVTVVIAPSRSDCEPSFEGGLKRR